MRPKLGGSRSAARWGRSPKPRARMSGAHDNEACTGERATRAREAALSRRRLGDAARVAPVDKLSVILVALFGVTFLGERLSATNWLGVALVGGGVLLLTLR